MRSYKIYWLHQPEQTDPYTQGYVGMTSNVKKRFRKHQKRFPLDCVMEVLHENLSRCEACHLEHTYRPHWNIDVNEAPGGLCRAVSGHGREYDCNRSKP